MSSWSIMSSKCSVTLSTAASARCRDASKMEREGHRCRILTWSRWVGSERHPAPDWCTAETPSTTPRWRAAPASPGSLVSDQISQGQCVVNQQWLSNNVTIKTLLCFYPFSAGCPSLSLRGRPRKRRGRDGKDSPTSSQSESWIDRMKVRSFCIFNFCALWGFRLM